MGGEVHHNIVAGHGPGYSGAVEQVERQRGRACTCERRKPFRRSADGRDVMTSGQKQRNRTSSDDTCGTSHENSHGFNSGQLVERSFSYTIVSYSPVTKRSAVASIGCLLF